MRGGEKGAQAESTLRESDRDIDASPSTAPHAEQGMTPPADTEPAASTGTSGLVEAGVSNSGPADAFDSAPAGLVPSTEASLEANSSSDWKQQLEREYADLKRARDELRIKAHLARADIRDAWEELEARWPRVESSLKRFEGQATQALDEFGHATRTLFRELRRGYQRVKKDL
ncbi:MAG: hypothetical protein AAF735_03660 [Myxococcota bacterium]